MLFSSLTFLFAFLPSVLALYFIIPKKFKQLKNYVLLIFSLIFYAWGEPKYIFLMIATVFISYVFGLLINYFDNINNKKLKVISLVVSIVLILASLIYFKYTNFIFENINNLINTNLTIKNIILPIGISFYTFQILSYIIDLYRKKIAVQKNFFNLALYISFFPQLIAGPIVQYKTIEDQLLNRKESFNKFVGGIERFIVGLSKKVIIANNMALIADVIFDSDVLSSYSTPVILLGIVAYTFQIYFDFSGYSDMAIGLGKIFGFEFDENFNYPYMSKSIGDFWKRWHISLTTFFREYLYFPLGGNRVSKKRWILNLFIVWLLTGIWHGAAWTFIIWGLYYFILLILERTVLKNAIEKIPNILRHLFTIILIMIGWTIFRANNLSDLMMILKNIFTNLNGLNLGRFIYQNPDIIPALPYLLLALIFSFNIIPKLNKRFDNSRIYNISKRVVLLCLFVICISMLVSSMYNPFIYFRF